MEKNSLNLWIPQPGPIFSTYSFYNFCDLFDLLDLAVKPNGNKVGCVSAVPSRRDTQSSIHFQNPSHAPIYNPLRLQLAANVLLPSMIQPGGNEEQEEKILVDHGKFFPVFEEDDDDDTGRD